MSEDITVTLTPQQAKVVAQALSIDAQQLDGLSNRITKGQKLAGITKAQYRKLAAQRREIATMFTKEVA